MALQAVCPHCKKEFQLRDDAEVGVVFRCPACKQQQQVALGTSLAFALRKEQALSGRIFDPEVLAEDLVEDCNRLLKLGIMLDKGALGAKAVGIGGGAFAAAQGHWLIGVAIAVVGLLSNVFTEDWKRIKLGEVRQKWFQRLSSMDKPQLHALMGAIQQRHPAMLMQARGMLALSCSMDT